MKLKHYAILCAPILFTIATHMKAATVWSEVFVPHNMGEVLGQTAIVFAALSVRSPKDDTHMDELVDANEDLRRRAGSYVGSSDR